jgi:signal transduction histidine kinase
VVPVSPLAGPAGPSGEPGLRRLAASLAHNLNNTLTGVIGYLELALREAPSAGPLHEHLQRSLSCSHRIAEMVRRVVAFAFQPAGQGRLEPVSLRRTGEQLARSLREPASPGLSVAFEAETDGLVRSNRPLLALVLDQLVSNALEAMPQGGSLTLRVWEDGPRRCLSLTDTGPGMSAEVQARLFEPFFTTKFSGHLGLGLALSRDVVQALGGAIQVVSVEGRGTTVTLAFPAVGQVHREDLPIDERLSQLLLSGRSVRPAGPHFSRTQPAAEPGASLATYAI